VKVLDDLRDQTALVSAMSWQQAPSWEQEATQHRAILAAAQAGNADVATGLLRQHISGFAARHFAPATLTAADTSSTERSTDAT
jgi:DNA-binding GntR family transcriptional regulator